MLHVTWRSLCVAPQPFVSLSSVAVAVVVVVAAVAPLLCGLTFVATSGAPLATLAGEGMFQQRWFAITEGLLFQINWLFGL